MKVNISRRKFCSTLVLSSISISLSPLFLFTGCNSSSSSDTNFLLSDTSSDTLIAMIERIVPSDETAGAAETKTGQTVKSIIESKGQQAVLAMQNALDTLDTMAINMFRLSFTALDNQQKDQLLSVVATDTNSSVFWSTIRDLSIVLHYSQPLGYNALGLPGPSIDTGGFPKGRSLTSNCPILSSTPTTRNTIDIEGNTQKNIISHLVINHQKEVTL